MSRWTEPRQTVRAAGLGLLGWVPWLCRIGLHWPTRRLERGHSWARFYDRECVRCHRYRIADASGGKP